MSIKAIVKNILQKSRERRALKQASVMRNSGDANTQLIAGAIIGALRGELSAEEQKWVSQIESLRTQLKGDNSVVHIMDFGAGGPESSRSDEEMYRGVAESTTVAAMSHSSKPPLEARILFKLIRTFDTRCAIELGTCLGISAAYQSAAQQLNGKGGKLFTLEGSDALAALSRKHLQQLNLVNAQVVPDRFQDNLQQVLEQNKPIDYIFIDGHHDQQATINYYHAILPYLADRALIVFDDIHWSTGMTNAWNTIIAHEQIKLAVDFKTIGICVADRHIGKQEGWRL